MTQFKRRITDLQMLTKLLLRPDISRRLKSLTDLALEAKSSQCGDDKYKAVYKPFCDGFQITLGRIQKHEAIVTSRQLGLEIQPELKYLLIQNRMYQAHPNGSVIWFTLNPETTGIDCRTMTDLLKIVLIIKSHAKAHWGYNQAESKKIRISKIDIARDHEGSFIPEEKSDAYDDMSETLEFELGHILNSKTTNFLSIDNVGDLTITKNGNNLETCFQFDAKDDDRDKILTVKVYDKCIDLISKDGSKMVGSKTNAIVCSKQKMSLLNQRLCQTYKTGMTRLEVSIHDVAIQKYDVTMPSFKTGWHERVSKALDSLTKNFLNDEDHLDYYYRRI